MSIPVLPVSFVGDTPGIVPPAPANMPKPVTGVSRDREKDSSRQKRKKKNPVKRGEGEKPSPDDPKGKKINILA
jgi:hypothetical protein